MTISGHKTRSVCDRDNIVSPDDLKEAAVRRQEYRAKRAQQLHFDGKPQKAKKGYESQTRNPLISWCRRTESNRHAPRGRGILSPLRLPVSPLRRVGFDYRFGAFKVKKIVFDNAEMRVLNGVLFFQEKGL